MKQGLNRYMEIQLSGMEPYWSDIARIEIVFAQARGLEPLKTAVYTPGSSADAIRSGQTLLIPWTREETYLFRADREFWIDIRPTLQDGADLEVAPVSAEMSWTLFKEGSA